MAETVTQIKISVTIIVHESAKIWVNIMWGKKVYLEFYYIFLCENVKYLGIIIGETGIMCDKTMEWEKLFEQKHFKKI